MLQQLALLARFGLDGADPTSAEFIHTVVECAKLAYADREKFYGDPEFVEVPGETLLSEAYNAERRKLVGEMASLEQRPGTIKGFGKQLPLRVPAGARTVAAGAGEPTVGKIWTHDDAHDPSVIVVEDAKLDSAGACAATPCISTSSTRPATWCRRRRRAAGCNPRRRSPSSASASARARSSSGSTRAIPPRSRPASARAPRSRRRWRCATASRTSPGVRPAATSRISGPRSSSCATCIAG